MTIWPDWQSNEGHTQDEVKDDQVVVADVDE